MRRSLFTIFSVLSLLLFVAAVAMWVRSYWWWETVQYRHGTRWFALGSGSGQVVAISATYAGDVEHRVGWAVESERAGYSSEAPEPLLAHLFAVAVAADAGSFLGVSFSTHGARVPYVYVLLLTLVLPGDLVRPVSPPVEVLPHGTMRSLRLRPSRDAAVVPRMWCGSRDEGSRMRPVFTILSALSLPLCVAVLGELRREKFHATTRPIDG